MGSGRWFLLVSGILLQLFVLSISQGEFSEKYCNYDYKGTYTSNSTFRRNLDSVPSFFTSKATFYNFSVGQNTDKVNVIALCRGDIGLDACRTCLNESNTRLRELCPSEKESIRWSDNCMLRYSDRAIFNTINNFPNAYAYNEELAPDANQFNKAVRTLLNNLRVKAANGSSVIKFATGNISVTNDMTIFGLVQCTPDLTGQQCSDCLNGAAEVLPTCCDGKIGGREVRPSCNFRYEIGPFYSVTASDAPVQPNAPPSDNNPSSPPSDNNPPSPPSPTGSGLNKTTVIIISTIVPTIIIAIILCIFIFRRNRKQRTLEDKYDALDEMSSEESLQYDFDTIKIATQHFSDSNKLGQGGFGAVYKGRLFNGQEIAVKRLSRDSGQGELEFKNEVSLLAKLQHRNLVRLLGYSLKGTERLLIYEFVPNGSLDNFIFDQEKRANLDLDTRYNIITGVARGLLYLHEDSRLRIIHRDLKTGNILLDVDMYPKIADFGMAKLFAQEETRATTSRIVGTYGYMAPEYAMLGQFSVKSDVFSFGVLVLEIISGQKNNFRNGENIEYLLSNAWKSWRDGRASDVIDPVLRQGAGSIHDITRCVQIALLCVQENIADRPTMASVILMLSSVSLTLRVPSEPAFFNNTSMSDFGDYTSEESEHSQSKNKPAQLSQNEVSITELSAR